MDNDSIDILTGNSNEIRPHPPENEGVWVGVGEASELYDNFLELKRQEYLASGHLTKFYEVYPEIVKWASNKFPKTGSQKISQKK